MSDIIELIGGNGEASPYLPEDVRRLLASPEIGLSFGAEFMGRPGTKVFSCASHVVKLRGELRLKEPVARRWCLHTLERERRYAVHHPAKTWFLVGPDDSGDTRIGNICPRLTPLHSLLQAPPTSSATCADRLHWLAALLDMDARLNAQEEMRLDLGLSNFGLDAEGRLYYLDDDFYLTDGFVSLAQMLGVYLRNHAWMDAVFAAELGEIVRVTLLRHCFDAHCLAVLAEQLRNVFMPNADRRAAMQALLDRLACAAKAAQASVPAVGPVRRTQRYFALLADVHANLPALEAVLGFLQRENIREGMVLGDVVGYGPHPVECIERLQDGRLELALLRGNHDHAAATGVCGQGFGNSARWCIEWTIPRLNEAHKAWLLALPLFLQGEGWLAVHGAPVDPGFFNAYVYTMTYTQNLDALQRRGIALCFHGHSHMQGVYARDRFGADIAVPEKQLTLADYRHCLVCPGSVGQPRNRDTGAQLAVLDWETWQLRFFSLPYAMDRVQCDMERAGFPAGLTNRLLTGR